MTAPLQVEVTTQLALGLVRQQRGMRLAETAEAIHSAWVAEVDNCIAWWARSGRTFSAEDIRQEAGNPTHPNAMGARFSAAARRGIIVPVGITKATRPDRHASLLRLWVGKWTKNGEEVVGYLYPEGPR